MKFSSINKSKIFNWSILLFSLFPILPNKIKGLPVILLLITSLFFFKRKNIMWWRFFLNSSLYFLFLFSFFITENIGLEAKFRLETTLSILVIPVIFYILIPSVKFQKKLLNNFIRVFIFSSIVFMLIVFLYIILDRDTIYYSSWFANKARTLIVEVPYIGQHPIYASIFSSISLIFIIKLFRQTHFIWPPAMKGSSSRVLGSSPMPLILPMAPIMNSVLIIYETTWPCAWMINHSADSGLRLLMR